MTSCTLDDISSACTVSSEKLVSARHERGIWDRDAFSRVLGAHLVTVDNRNTIVEELLDMHTLSQKLGRDIPSELVRHGGGFVQRTRTKYKSRCG